MTDYIRLIIADDHPIVRGGMRQFIEAENDLKIIAECGDGEEALNKIISLKPDIAILDIDMPKMDGIVVLETLREQNILCLVIFLTVHNDENFFRKAIRLGASGYVIKDSAAADIVNAIRTVSQGKNYMSPTLTPLFFKHSRPLSEQTGIESLTPTERRVLRLIAEYQTNNQIAQDLKVSPQTIKVHRRNAAQKLGIEGSHALMKFALENKFEL